MAKTNSSASDKLPVGSAALRRKVQVKRFREGEIDKESISAMTEATNKLFDRLARVWSERYFAAARVHMYDDGDDPENYERVYLSFHRGDEGWGLFIEREHCCDVEGETIRDIPIGAASNTQKELAIDTYLGVLEPALKHALERKRLAMIERHDALAAFVQGAKKAGSDAEAE